MRVAGERVELDTDERRLRHLNLQYGRPEERGREVAHEGFVSGEQDLLEFAEAAYFVPHSRGVAFRHQQRCGFDSRLHPKHLPGYLSRLDRPNEGTAKHELGRHAGLAGEAKDSLEFGPAFVGELALRVRRSRPGIFGDAVPE